MSAFASIVCIAGVIQKFHTIWGWEKTMRLKTALARYPPTSLSDLESIDLIKRFFLHKCFLNRVS